MSGLFDVLLKESVSRTLDMRDGDGRVHYRDVLILLAHFSADHQKILDKRLMDNVSEAMMHLETNYDVEGDCMDGSDAYQCLLKIIPDRAFNKF